MRARARERLEGASESELANVAATLVFIMLGPKALEALAKAAQQQRQAVKDSCRGLEGQ
jgi:hypothetical protein